MFFFYFLFFLDSEEKDYLDVELNKLKTKGREESLEEYKDAPIMEEEEKENEEKMKNNFSVNETNENNNFSSENEGEQVAVDDVQVDYDSSSSTFLQKLKNFKLFQLFRRNIIKTTLLSLIVWFVNVFAYYGVKKKKNLLLFIFLLLFYFILFFIFYLFYFI